MSVTLQSVEKEHLCKFKVWRNELRQYFRQNHLLNDVNQQDWFEKISRDERQCVFSIFALPYGIPNEILVGCCGLHYISWTNRTAEFGIYINKSEQGNGYGKLALNLLLSYGFNELNLNRIWGEVYSNNPAIDLYLRMGFKKEGELRNHYYFGGQYFNSIMIGMLSSEFSPL